MKIIRNLDFQLNHTAVCIGKFDGIHRGHRLLLEEAKKSGYPTVMFTFSMDRKGIIYSETEKVHLAEHLGIEILIVVPFDEQIKQKTAEEFVEEILIRRCDAKKVVVGDDFRFGRERKGDASLLKELGLQYGFETTILKKMVEDGEVISSTRIRELLQNGKLKEANALLKTPYFIMGNVRKGNQIGRKIDTPTANIYPDEVKELPPYGVYATFVEVDGERYAGVGNLGRKPTIGDDEPVGLEVWLFEYEGDLYEKEIIVYLLDFQRREKKFESLEQLKQQIREDSMLAKQTTDELI